ncbi:hypothetical+protein [Methylocapsa aurea]|jgi:hypothetical protein|uniref:hypothetical protein n=1 Tax=Methylocapsa aurea TaxID=663610 RepID=UPI003D18B160
MTPREIGQLIIDRWRMDYGANAIMVLCITRGAPVSKSEVMTIVRAYVEAATENKRPQRGPELIFDL